MNKTFIRNLAIGVVAVGMLFGLGYTASKTVAPAIAQYITSRVDVVTDPTPTPTNAPPAPPAPVVEVTPAPLPTPTVAPPTIEPFPAQPSPVAVPAGVTPPPPIPATMVNVGTAPLPSNAVCCPNGAVTCTGPCTITWQACFQGGFTGLTVETCGVELSGVTFTWSDGHVGSTDTVAYPTVGKSSISVSVTETYNGHTYWAGAGDGVPVTVNAS